MQKTIKLLIIPLLFTLMVLNLQAQEQSEQPKQPEDPRDVLIGSFASSVVYLIHSNFDTVRENVDGLLENKEYYGSLHRLLSVINDNFKKQLSDLIENGNISDNDIVLLKKLSDLSDIYKKQLGQLNNYLNNENEEDMEKFLKTHSEAKSKLKDLFNK